MVTIRKVTLALLVAVALVVLVLTVLMGWNYRQWSYVPLHGPYASELDERSHILADRVEILTKRVSDMELLVLVLLGSSGLYAIVFVATSYVSAMSFARQADRSIASIKDQVGLALGDLRELKEETERKIREKLETLPPATNLEAQAAAIGAEQLASSLAELYLEFARLHAQDDAARARSYLNRALALSEADSPAASEIHYELACWFARNGDLEEAAGQLSTAFKHQSKALDARLARDIEEGGDLFEVANAVPDVLLNVVL